MHPTTTAEIGGILLWAGVVAALFVLTTPRRAVLVGLVGGWLLLPDLVLEIAGPLPNLTKASITGLGLAGLVLLFDRARLRSLRPRWLDVPMLVWCGGPFITALVNGEGLYEAVSAAGANAIVWGIPYLLGRLYLQDAEGWRDLALAIFIGGLVYVPLCWIEILRSPLLAWQVYGYVPVAIRSAYSFGGWRPIVFMSHGLMVALWMTAATLSGAWLWRAGILPRVGRIPTWILVLVLLLTTLALRSVNAWLLLVAGVGILWLSTRLRTTWLAWGVLALIVVYLAVRASGAWGGQELITLTAGVIPGKINSVSFRLLNERILTQRALQAPLLGWGRFGRSLPPEAIPDSRWIIAFGEQGIVGLTALYSFLLLPMILLLRRVPVTEWAASPYAPAVGLAVILLLYSIDNLANAMPNPVYLLVAGGLLTLPHGAAHLSGRRAGTLLGVPLSAPSPKA